MDDDAEMLELIAKAIALVIDTGAGGGGGGGEERVDREAELSETDFESTFGMTKEAFYGLAKWKQTKLKKEHDLF